MSWGGFAEVDEGGVSGHQGVRRRVGRSRSLYRKVHLWDDENSVFVPSDRPPLVVDREVGRIGACICYEMELPEWIRTAALQGMDILGTPHELADVAAPVRERPIEVTPAQASVSVDRICVAVCDQVGPQGS